MHAILRRYFSGNGWKAWQHWLARVPRLRSADYHEYWPYAGDSLPTLNEQKTPEGEPLQGKALQDFVIDKIDDLKGQDIVALNVQGKSSITDCMIICTGNSSRHVMSIADHVVQESRAAGLIPLGVEGQNISDWVVVDLGDVIVHVMQEDSRRLYELEKLWS
ncbi:hypothetical protein GCM10023078_46440 [Gibbsiella greigii]